MAPLAGIAVVVLVGWLAGDRGAPDRVVLLPGPDGKVGKVVVKSAGGERLLDSAFAEAAVGHAGRIETRTADEAAVRERYATTLDARPPRPVSYRVYFVSGSDALTPESQPAVSEMKKALAGRPAPEITVVGHTDRVGKVEDNDALSRRRAVAVRDILVGQGIAASAIEVAGRGEREPLVPTADEVPEALNRRVEIDVR